MKTGYCKYKSACKFHHPKTPRPSKTTAFILSSAGLPLRPCKSPSSSVYHFYLYLLLLKDIPISIHIERDKVSLSNEIGYSCLIIVLKISKSNHIGNGTSSNSFLLVYSASFWCISYLSYYVTLQDRKICWNYENFGICKYGRSCFFHHPENPIDSIL